MNEVEIVASVFKKEFTYLMYEHIVTCLKRSKNKTLYNTYEQKLKQAHYSLSDTMLSNFTRTNLWFATFSTDPWNSTQQTTHTPYAGSIYFTGGRIRLIHENGPRIEYFHSPQIRTLGGEKIYDPTSYPITNDNVTFTSLAQHLNFLTTNHPHDVLVEYYSGAKIGSDKPAHTSRGVPKTIQLLDSDIIPLYQMVARLQQPKYHLRFVIRSSRQFAESQTYPTLNKILIDFIKHSPTLYYKLGYSQF